MGIRFICPNGHRLHVKNFLAGKRGVCPKCGVGVEIPRASTYAVAPDGPPPASKANTGEEPLPRESESPQWYVRLSSGEQFGPASDSVFHEWVSEGRLTPDSQVWKEGWPDWKASIEVLDLPKLAASEPAPPEPPPVAADEPSSVPEPAAVGEIQINTDAPIKNKKKSRALVYFLLATCVVLSLVMVYVLTNN